MLRVLPLVIAVTCLGVLLVIPWAPRLDTWLTRVAFVAFGGRRMEHNPNRERILRSASIGIPYREYATKTYLYVAGIGISGTILGIYVSTVALFALQAAGIGGDPSGATEAFDIFRLDGSQVVLVGIGSVLIGGTAAAATHTLRWRIPSIRADARRREIDAGLPRMVAFMYALTRGGMSFPDVLRTLAANEPVFGEGAAEIEIAVRNIDLFSVDLVTAVKDLSEDTPSEQFGMFTENLASVLQSGGNVSEFLHNQYERYREEAEDQQTEILNLLATTAEVYVTVIVAGMLFLITILLVIGLTAGETRRIMQLLAYVIIPAANLLFLAYLLDITQPLRASGDERGRSGRETAAAIPTQTDAGGGEYTQPDSVANHERLDAYRRLQSVRSTLSSPIESLLSRPSLVLYLTVPIAVIVTAIRLPEVVSGNEIDVRQLDDLLVQATIFLTGTFAIVYEYSRRRLRRLESSLPDLLERLASLNEAGISVTAAFDRVRRDDLGALGGEIDRISRDMTWGATTEHALLRFKSRVQTPSVTRVVTLLTNAMHASNEIGPVLRIAAEQARSDLHLRRQRKQEMFTYLVVVYISFLVFLIVIAALEYVLIPSLPDMSALGNGAAGVPGPIGGFEGGNTDAYRLVFFHTALIQSTLSGLVAGVMGGGSVKDGMKHAAIMLSITYIVLAVLL